jgi:hypothetical protein
MLSGQITKSMARDALDELLEGLTEELYFIIARNARILREDRSTTTFSYEQKQLIEAVTNNPAELVEYVIESINAGMHDIAFEGVMGGYVDQAHLEKRGW